MPPENEVPVSDAGQQKIEGVVVPKPEERTAPGCMETEQNMGRPMKYGDGIPSPPTTSERLQLLEGTVSELAKQTEALILANSELRSELQKTLTEHGNLLGNITLKADIYGKNQVEKSEEALAEARKILLWLELNAPRKDNSKYYEAMNPMLVNFFINLFSKYTGTPFEEILSEITDKDIKSIVNKMIKNREKGSD